jgi:hypothetical protein
MRARLDTSQSAEYRAPETPIRDRSSRAGQQGRVHGSRDPTPEAPEEKSHSPSYWPPTDIRYYVKKDVESKSLLDELRAGSEVEECGHAPLGAAFDNKHLPRARNPFATPPRDHVRKDDAENTARLQGNYTELTKPTKDRAGRAVIPVDIPAVPFSTSDDPYRQSPNPMHTTMDSEIALSDEDARKLSPQALRDQFVTARPSSIEYSNPSFTKEQDVVHPRRDPVEERARGFQRYAPQTTDPNTSF